MVEPARELVLDLLYRVDGPLGQCFSAAGPPAADQGERMEGMDRGGDAPWLACRDSWRRAGRKGPRNRREGFRFHKRDICESRPMDFRRGICCVHFIACWSFYD